MQAYIIQSTRSKQSASLQVSRNIFFYSIFRLGALGFLSTGDSASLGNFGVWDSLTALKWVQQNIAAFGGDKDRVTLLGQSAGV